MPANFWIGLSETEHSLLIGALSYLRNSQPSRTAEINALCEKLRHAESHPRITVGVYGGQIQWVLGNPFPIRICDYDGEAEELPDLDDRNQRCRMWIETADDQSQAGERSR